MEQRLHRIEVATRGRGLTEITREVRGWVAGTGLGTGLLTLWCRHTSASLLVQENASPDVRTDLETFLRRLVPDGGDGRYRHEEEGPDDMPAHIRAALTQTQLSIPVAEGRPVLGTWQGIYLYEHRTSPHRRELVLHLLGEA
ncbi:secondary thiamine-phosphate synthase enzyme YjbQ [Paracraurococcus lichenis]|uniref:Secondary thiamine-phosphate synthase enzyme YjbQ n=1 Tax=Paracraurococcus lichenis TaxID=3064888 RepID=A0ABT9E407_9PROT|nr:secondary thiamine-phosphate synthase enzyme YjbQ [Paracraurococcus sp. LOR1-02]MDO9710891.1 secondary thiamine-phosphate synthase enzyme YjbQ [Paracraurococcus sp. LOR1-02]